MAKWLLGQALNSATTRSVGRSSDIRDDAGRLRGQKRSEIVLAPPRVRFDGREVASFVATSIEAWWEQVGEKRYPSLRESIEQMKAGQTISLEQALAACVHTREGPIYIVALIASLTA